MALSSTLYTFDIELAHVDRDVYETLNLRVACHPSEAEEYLVTRVLAYCLEYAEGIAFSRGGISDPDDPPLSVRDLTGAITAWVEIGAPDADRLHKASKASPRVAIYTQHEVRSLHRRWEGARIHRAESIEGYAVDRALIAALVERLDRRMKLALSVTDGHLFVTIGNETLEGRVERFGVQRPT
jgi:uncharacterized protein YaeQ